MRGRRLPAASLAQLTPFAKALRAALARAGGKVHALDAETNLAAYLDPVQRLAIVEAIERRAGFAPAELGDAYLVRTVGELVAAVAAYLGRRR